MRTVSARSSFRKSKPKRLPLSAQSARDLRNAIRTEARRVVASERLTRHHRMVALAIGRMLARRPHADPSHVAETAWAAVEAAIGPHQPGSDGDE